MGITDSPVDLDQWNKIIGWPAYPKRYLKADGLNRYFVVLWAVDVDQNDQGSIVEWN